MIVMVDVDRSQMADLVASLSSEANEHNQRWQKWIGVASAGGIVAILTFAANLPNPEFALNQLEWSITAFGLSLLLAGLAAPLAAKRVKALSSHYAAAATRDSLDDAIAKMPEIIASPRDMAKRMNRGRDHLKSMRESEDEDAEGSWQAYERWKILHRVVIGGAMLGFAIGLAIPILLLHLDVSFVS